MTKLGVFFQFFQKPLFDTRTKVSAGDGTSTARLTLLLFVAVCFLALHIQCKPFDNRAYHLLDRVELASLWAVVFTLVAKIFLDATGAAHIFVGDQESRSHFEWSMYFLVLLFHLRFLCLVVWGLFRPFLRPWLERVLPPLFGANMMVFSGDEGTIDVSALDGTERKMLAVIFEEMVETVLDPNRRGLDAVASEAGKLHFPTLAACFRKGAAEAIVARHELDIMSKLRAGFADLQQGKISSNDEQSSSILSIPRLKKSTMRNMVEMDNQKLTVEELHLGLMRLGPKMLPMKAEMEEYHWCCRSVNYVEFCWKGPRFLEVRSGQPHATANT